MGKLFDHALPEIYAPLHKPAPKRRHDTDSDANRALPTGAPHEVWKFLLDQGIDPVGLAALLRDSLSPIERKRAYLELVRDLGPTVAERIWARSMEHPSVQRRAFPIAAREISEALVGQSLVGIHAVTGELVELVAARLGTPAFAIGAEVFVTDKGMSSHAVLVHEAVHVAQQRASSPGRALVEGLADAEHEAHRLLRRVGHLENVGQRIARGRARASMAVRAALGRSPKISSQPASLAAYEPTLHDQAVEILEEGKRLAAALAVMLDRGADAAELHEVLGPLDDDRADRIRKVALYELGRKRDARGRNVRELLEDAVGRASPLFRGRARGRGLDATTKAELGSKLDMSLDDVRVYDDESAAARAEKLGAQAYTSGSEIHFADGKYDPSTEEGKLLLAHELVHVKQQHGRGKAATQNISETGSAVEREADRVAAAAVGGAKAGTESLAVRESAASGTISKKDEAPAGGGATPTGNWALRFLSQAMDIADLAQSDNTGDGFRLKGLEGRKVGPVKIDEVKVQWENNAVTRGTVKASIDDGRFRGSSATLSIDGQGNVTGQLTVELNVPNALVKTVKVEIGSGPIQVTIGIEPGDFKIGELPLAGGGLSLVVTSADDAINARIDGTAKVKLDKGFASGEGTITALLTTEGGINFSATVQAQMAVAGLDTAAQATMKYQGGVLTIEAGLQQPIKIPGLDGNVSLKYAGNKLTGEIPDLKFTSAAMQGFKFDTIKLDDGKISGGVSAVEGTTLGVPGAQVKLKGSTKLTIDGTKIDGNVEGAFELGPGPIVKGDFSGKYGEAGMDGSIANIVASVPFLTVEGVTIGIKGLGTTNDFSVSGNMKVDIGGGLIHGTWSDLAYANGSITGGVHVAFNIPKLTLPEVDFQVLPGWRVQGNIPALKASLNLGGELGELNALDINIKTTETDINNFPNALGDITAKAPVLQVPKFAQFGQIENLDAKIPGSGGNYKFDQASGTVQLKITKFGPEPVVITFTLANGQLSASGGGTIDVNKVSDKFSGTATVKFDAGQLSVTAESLEFTKEPLAGKVKVNNFKYDYASSAISAKLSAQDAEFEYKGMKARLKSGEFTYDNGTITGNATADATIGGVNVEVKVKYENDQLTFEGGKLKLNFDDLSKGFLSGAGEVEANSDLEVAVEITRPVKVTKAPFDSISVESIKYKAGSYSAAFKVTEGNFSYKGISLSKVNANFTVEGNDGGAKFNGSLQTGASVKVGEKEVFAGQLAVKYDNGTFSGSVTVDSLKLSFGDIVKLSMSGGLTITLKEDGGIEVSGEPRIDMKAGKIFDGYLTAKVNANEIESFGVNGVITEGPLWTQVNLNGLTYNISTGQLDGTVSGNLKNPGTVQPNAKFDVGYKGGQLTAWVEDQPFSVGRFNGWKVSGGLRGGQFFGALKCGQDTSFPVGPATITIKNGSSLDYNETGGISGKIDAKLEFKGSSLDLSATFKNNDLEDIKSSADVDVGKFISALTGKLHVAYKKGDPDPLTIRGEGLKATGDPWSKYVEAEYIEYKGGEFSGKIKVQDVEIEAKGFKLKVVESNIEYKGGEFKGEAKLAVKGGPVSDALMTVKYDGSKWDIGGEVTVDLSKINKHLSGTATVKASTGNGLEEVTAKGAKFTWGDKSVGFDDLKYKKSPEEIKATVTLDADKFNKIPPLKLEGFKSHLTVEKVGDDYNFEGSVESGVKVEAGGKELVSGSLKAEYAKGVAKGKIAIDNAAPMNFGQVSITIEGGTSVDYDSEKGITQGTLKANVKIGTDGEFSAKATIKDNELDTVEIAGGIPIKKIFPPLTGNLTFKYVKGAADPIDITGTNIMASDPMFQKYVKIPEVSYVGGKFKGQVDIQTGNIKIGDWDIAVSECTLALDGDTFSGQATFTAANGLGDASITMKYAGGQFKISGEITVYLSKFSTRLSGTAKAKGSSDGGVEDLVAENAAFQISDGKSIAIPTFKYKKGPPEEVDCEVVLTANDFGAIPNVAIDNFVAQVRVKKTGGSYDFSGKVTGSAKVTAAGKTLVDGKLDASYVGGVAKGTVTLNEVAPMTFGPVEVTVTSGTTATYESDKGVTHADIGATVKYKKSQVTAQVIIENNDLKAINTSGDIQLEEIIPALKGGVSFKYDSGKFSGKGTNLKATNPTIAAYVQIPVVEYADDKLSGEIKITSGGPINVPGFGQIEVVTCDLKIDGENITGSATLKAHNSALDASIEIKYDGSKLDIGGEMTVDLAKVAPNVLSGTLKGKGSSSGGLTNLVATGAKIVKKPFDALTIDNITYSKGPPEEFAGQVSFAKDQFKLKNVDITDLTTTLGVKKVGDTAEYDGDLAGGITVKAGSKQLGSGAIDIHYHGGQVTGNVEVTQADFTVAGAEVSVADFKIGLEKSDDGVKFKAGGKPKLNVTHEYFKLGLQADLSGGSLSSLTADLEVKDTPLTKTLSVNGLGYNVDTSEITGEVKVGLKNLGGLIQDNAQVDFGMKGGNVTAYVTDLAVNSGMLKDWKFSGGLKDGKAEGKVVAPGGKWRLYNADITLDEGSHLEYAGAGFSGQVGGVIDVAGKTLKASVTFANNQVTDVTASLKLPIQEILPVLSGNLEVSYADKKIKVVGTDITPTSAKYQPYVTVEKVEYDDGQLSGSVKFKTGPFSFDVLGKEVKGEIKSGGFKIEDKKLTGEVHFKAGVGGVGAEGAITYDGKDFHVDATLTADLGVITGGLVTGVVSAGTGGNLSVDKPVKIEAFPSITIEDLKGIVKSATEVENLSFKVSLDNVKQSMNLGDNVNLTIAGGKIGLKWDGSLHVSGGVKGHGEVKAGGKTVVSGDFEASYDAGKFGGKVENLKIDIETKYFKPKGGALIDLDKGEFKVGALFHIPGIVKSGDVDLEGNVKSGDFKAKAELNLEPAALSEVKVSVEVDSAGTLNIKASLEGTKTFKLPGGAELTMDAGSHIEYAGGTLSGQLKGTAKLGKLMTGTFDFTIAGASLSGDLKLQVHEVPFLKGGIEVDASFHNNAISTKKPVRLEWNETIASYVEGNIDLEIHNNKVSAKGKISKIKKLGSIGEQVEGGDVSYNDESGELSVHGKIKLDKVPGVKKGSWLELGFAGNKFEAAGKVDFESVGGVKIEGGFSFRWTQGEAFFEGHAKADVYGLAEVEIKASTGKEEGSGTAAMPEGSTSFHIAGKLTATGLMKKFPQVQFSKDPSIAFWVTAGDGEVDYGMEDFSTSITKLPGVDSCNIAVQASYKKGSGFNAKVDLGTVKIKMFKLTGGIEIQDSKFQEGHIGIESDVAAVNLKGGITIAAGDMSELNATARVDVVPGAGSALKWLESGYAEVKFEKGKLTAAKGEIKIRKPPLLPLENTTLMVEMRGDDIAGSLTSDFKMPMAVDGKMGKLKVEFGGAEKWSVSVDAWLKPPGFKEIHIHGGADGAGNFNVEGTAVPENTKYIQAASLHVRFTGGDFKMGGSVTFKISDKLSGEVEVEYDSGKEDFWFKGTIKPTQTPEPKSTKELGGFAIEQTIPLFGVGFLNVVLDLSASLKAAIDMPQVNFQSLSVEGSMKSLLDGKLPLIRAVGDFNMGIGVTLKLGVGIAGELQLLVATAKAGIKGEFRAKLGLKIGAKVEGVFGGDHDGLDITVTPYVTPEVVLEAALVAFAKAKVFGFTIIDKEWDLATFQLSAFTLPSWMPVKPFGFNIGGSNPGFKGDLEMSKDDPPGLVDGAKKGGEEAQDEAKNGEAKKKVRPVMQEILSGGAKLDAMPPNWQQGITKGDDLQSLVDLGDACDFYANCADKAEDWLPDMKASSPGQLLAKDIATGGWFDRMTANMKVLSWRQAQVASMGIDPTTGVDVVAEHGLALRLQENKYNTELAAAIAKQVAQDEEHAAAVAQQQAQYAEAVVAHDLKVQQIQEEYDQKVKEILEQEKAVAEKLKAAEKLAEEEGVDARALAEEKEPPPPIPPPPLPPPPLAEPAPIPRKPPIPMPAKPAPIPPPIIPAYPTGPGSVSYGSGTAPVQEAKPVPAPVPTPEAPTVPDAAAHGAAGESGQVGGGGGGGGKPSGGGDPDEMGLGTPKSGGGGGGGAAVDPGPSGNLGKQHSYYEKKIASFGYDENAVAAQNAAAEAGAAVGAAEPAPAAAPEAAPAGAPADGGAAANNGAGGSGAAGAAPPPAAGGGGGGGGGASLDPTVQAVVDGGKETEKAQEDEAKQKEDEYDKELDAKKQTETKATNRIDEATKKAVAEREAKKKEKGDTERKMPPAGDFPAGTGDQARVAFTNYSMMTNGEGEESLLMFTERYAGRQYFNFEARSWGNIVDEYQKIFDSTPPEEELPDVQEFCDKLYSGSTYAGAKEYKEAGGFDPSKSMTDEGVEAEDRLKLFKGTYGGQQAGDYLGKEATGMESAQKTAFVQTNISPIAAVMDKQKVTRAALEKQGPMSEVAETLGKVDAGTSVDGPTFWAEIGAAFQSAGLGAEQINGVITSLEKIKKEQEKDAQKGGAGAEGAKPTEGEAAEADQKTPGQEAGDKEDGKLEGSDEAGPVVMLKWSEAEAKFAGLVDGAMAAVLAQLGVAAGGDVGSNQQAALEKRKTDLAALLAAQPEAEPEAVFAQWVAENHPLTVQVNKAVATMAEQFGGAIQELRQKSPRLDQDALAQAAATLRRAVGSNALVFGVGEVNPPETKTEEKVDPSVAMKPVEGGDWNPLLDPAWISAVYEKFDPALIEEIKKDNPALAGKDGEGDEGEEGESKDAESGPEAAAEGKETEKAEGESGGDPAAEKDQKGEGAPSPEGGDAPAIGADGGAASAAGAEGGEKKDQGDAPPATGGDKGSEEAKDASPAPAAAADEPKDGDGEQKPATEAGQKAQDESGDKSAESAPVEVSAEGDVAAKGGTPADEKQGADGQDEQSKFAEGPAPGDWQSRIVETMPSGGDDPGHTYNLLDDGTVVAQSQPQVAQGAAAQATMKQPEITAWRQEFEIKIGNSLVPEATATATAMAQGVVKYLEAKMGPLDASNKNYEAAMKQIGEQIGKADIDKDETIFGGGVRPEDMNKLIKELKENKTESFGLRERLLMAQGWFENTLSNDLITAEAEVTKWAQQAGMLPGKITSFFADAKATFDKKATGAGMKSWDDVAKMGDKVVGDPAKNHKPVAEQGKTREFVPLAQRTNKGHSDMTVAAFQELGGKLSNYELEKLIRLNGKEEEFLALTKGGMPVEAALKQMAGKMQDCTLPWSEGAKAFKPKVDALVAAQAPGSPQMAGTSGTTARLVETGGMLGVDKDAMIKACMAMLLPIRAHSLMEVVRGAGGDMSATGTVEDYKSVVPTCEALDAAGFKKVLASEKALKK